MLERQVEAHLLARCREMGFLCMKFASPGRAGVPDRIVLAPCAAVFVETKRPGGGLRRLQQATITKMRRAGAEVHVVDTVAGVDELVDQLAARTRVETRGSPSSGVYLAGHTPRGARGRPMRPGSESFDTIEEQI